MRNPCQSCGAMAQTGALLCRPCENQCRRNLGDMEALRQELDTTLTRQTHMTPDNDGGRSAETPLPYQQQASDLLSEQRALLVSWCRLINEELGARLPRRDTVRAMSITLEHHMGDLRTHEAVAELVDELSDLVRRIHKAIDYPDRKQTIGPCQEMFEDGQCPGQLVDHLPTDEGRKAWVECTACGSITDATVQLQEMATEPILMSVPDVAALQGIPRSTLTNWVSEGRLIQTDEGEIDMAAAVELRKATRKRKASA